MLPKTHFCTFTEQFFLDIWGSFPNMFPNIISNISIQKKKKKKKNENIYIQEQTKPK